MHGNYSLSDYLRVNAGQMCTALAITAARNQRKVHLLILYAHLYPPL